MADLRAVIDAGEDFEWYPTTDRMVDVVARHVSVDCESIMDIGAGDGRVLVALSQKATGADLYAIEKSHLLLQAQPAQIAPVGVDFHEQNLSSLPVDVIFCNPPYSEYEAWVVRIVETAYAERAFLVIPRRWAESVEIAAAVATRGARTRVIHSDDFADAERRARAVVDIVEVTFPKDTERWNSPPSDPFDQWFDQHISTFDVEATREEEHAGVDMARLRDLTSIAALVEAYDEDYARMEQNYRAIFALDYAILRELGVSKDGVRTGLKKRMAGLKTVYWQQLFEKLQVVTDRLTTATKARFLDRLTARSSVAFTADNAYAVVMWAIRNANSYFDEQLVAVFKALATHDGVSNYTSNVRTWQKDVWRYNAEQFSHFALDYRIVVERHSAIFKADFGRYDYPGDLHKGCHELLDDMVAVFANLGFTLSGDTPRSRARQWRSGAWQDFHQGDGVVLFQAKAYQNGNVHLRMMPKAIRTLNVEAGRLLGWLRGPDDVERELGYAGDEARALFGANQQLSAATLVRRLTA